MATVSVVEIWADGRTICQHRDRHIFSSFMTLWRARYVRTDGRTAVSSAVWCRRRAARSCWTVALCLHPVDGFDVACLLSCYRWSIKMRLIRASLTPRISVHMRCMKHWHAAYKRAPLKIVYCCVVGRSIQPCVKCVGLRGGFGAVDCCCR